MAKKVEKIQVESLSERLKMVFGHLTASIAIAENTKWQPKVQQIRREVAEILRAIEPPLQRESTDDDIRIQGG